MLDILTVSELLLFWALWGPLSPVLCKDSRPQRPSSQPQYSCCTHRNRVLPLSECISTSIFGLVGKQGCGLFSLCSVSLFYCCQNKGGWMMHCEIMAHTIMCLECKTFCWWCIFIQDGSNMAKPVGVHKEIGNILFMMLTGFSKKNTTALKRLKTCSFGFKIWNASNAHSSQRSKIKHKKLKCIILVNEPGDFYTTLWSCITLLSVNLKTASIWRSFKAEKSKLILYVLTN